MPEEKKSRYSESQKKATAKYMKAHLDDLKIRVPKGRRDYYKNAAAAAGLSLNAFAVSAMDEKIKRENLAPDFEDEE